MISGGRSKLVKCPAATETLRSARSYDSEAGEPYRSDPMSAPWAPGNTNGETPHPALGLLELAQDYEDRCAVTNIANRAAHRLTNPNISKGGVASQDGSASKF